LRKFPREDKRKKPLQLPEKGRVARRVEKPGIEKENSVLKKKTTGEAQPDSQWVAFPD